MRGTNEPSNRSISIDVKYRKLITMREEYDAKVEEDCPSVWSACGLSIAERDELTAMFWTATCVIEEMLRLRAVAHHAPSPLGHALVDI